MTFWTDEKTTMLRALAAERLSARSIALKISAVSRQAVSRQAVIGKCRRLGIRLNGSPFIKAGSVEAVRPLLRTPRMPKQKPVTVPAPHVVGPVDRDAPESLDLTLTEIERDDCRWPYGDRDRWIFCGHTTEPGKPYCLYHVRLSRGKGTQSERRAAGDPARAG